MSSPDGPFCAAPLLSALETGFDGFGAELTCGQPPGHPGPHRGHGPGMWVEVVAEGLPAGVTVVHWSPAPADLLAGG
ncbi:hypothetical protein JOF53_008384 [Crossiella equi]|uniref:Uncharacterized protein n=1 Tax=Crossiella equi TaxID=130796 RepID=A0ABS5ASE7_9PSEU|nr:hypothetical protein [Crossiella equi]MBP2479512.1 hypothetical protein [Crossiella equi]